MPPDLRKQASDRERVTGIEAAFSAWESEQRGPDGTTSDRSGRLTCGFPNGRTGADGVG